MLVSTQEPVEQPVAPTVEEAAPVLVSQSEEAAPVHMTEEAPPVELIAIGDEAPTPAPLANSLFDELQQNDEVDVILQVFSIFSSFSSYYSLSVATDSLICLQPDVRRGQQWNSGRKWTSYSNRSLGMPFSIYSLLTLCFSTRIILLSHLPSWKTSQ